MSANAASGSLGLCFAHPDDESYSTYGTVALHSRHENFRLAVLHATDGGAGGVAPGVLVSPSSLGAHRRSEADAAWRAVGRIPDRDVWLGHDDGQVAQVGHHRLVEQVCAFLDQERPDVVVTFGPDGITGHPDHLAIGQATDEAFHTVRRSNGPGLRRLLHTAIAATPFARHQDARVARGLPRWDPQTTYHLRAVPDDDIGVLVDTRPVADAVVAGLKAHSTQRTALFDPEGDDRDWRRYATREFHVVAWPPQQAGGPVLADVFEGLGA
ncbi:PIG-L deacetylase family protein [Pedococcus bigeumensis]|uniref:PIG-L family deacetylase n=1 Tax=Pedococcus bigeumensis TaxID=433644 RepID=A0A502D221_9MICO|nr:PIG-L family deacetylase [Pedococcus bigeumensis]TPG18166.1 PIG-L family deacetylase [Pedococcus bigeumensis]